MGLLRFLHKVTSRPPSRNLFIVATPFQLLGAIEAAAHFPATGNDLLLRFTYDHSPNMVQLLDLAKKHRKRFNRVIVKRYASRRRVWESDIRTDFRLIIRFRNRYKRVFLGDYLRHNLRVLAANIGASEVFLLDDGIATVTLQEAPPAIAKSLVDLRSSPPKARQYLQAAASTYHLATELPQIPNLFTMFDLQPREGQTVIRHTFAQLRSQHEASRQMLDHGTVYFLGQPLAERNIVTSEQAFNKMVCRVREHYPEKRFVYVRHRSEDLARCRRTISQAGIELKDFERSIELALLAETTIPHVVTGFNSTALISLKTMFPALRAEAWELSAEDLHPEHAERFAHTFTFLREQGLTVHPPATPPGHIVSKRPARTPKGRGKRARVVEK